MVLVLLKDGEQLFGLATGKQFFRLFQESFSLVDVALGDRATRDFDASLALFLIAFHNILQRKAAPPPSAVGRRKDGAVGEDCFSLSLSLSHSKNAPPDTVRVNDM